MWKYRVDWAELRRLDELNQTPGKTSIFLCAGEIFRPGRKIAGVRNLAEGSE
jgi:hypothetical protein